jgi:hypothetical protein
LPQQLNDVVVLLAVNLWPTGFQEENQQEVRLLPSPLYADRLERVAGVLFGLGPLLGKLRIRVAVVVGQGTTDPGRLAG